jgi:hypothetical protein
MRRLTLVLAWCGLAATSSAQTLPSEPVALAGGRVVLGGDVAVSLAPKRLATQDGTATRDIFDPGYFNYSDYEYSTLRNVRVDVTAAVRATDRVSFLGEMRTDNFRHLSPFAAYARVRPFPNRRFDLQIGRIPPTFGATTRTLYSLDNPLVGYPLAYQYLTSLRPDALPADVDELLRMRGRGWLSNFSVGNTLPAHGVPLVTAFSWDTGIQASTRWRDLTATAAVTNGSLSNPRVSDDNAGKQLAMRVSAAPLAGLILGSSFARGQFLSRQVLDAITYPDKQSLTQSAYGADIEYSRDHWLVRSDAVLSEWDLPVATQTATSLTLKALALRVEGRYAFMPGLFGAARVEHLAFNRVTGTTRTISWDAPVSRVEVGGGYYLQRNLVAKLSVQQNWRDGTRINYARFIAMQLLYWF